MIDEHADAAPPRAAGGCPHMGPREQAICAAAIQVLAEQGYDRMTMDAVAERARASKATIYRHWSGKGQLVADAVRARTEEVVPDVPDTGSLRGDVLVMLRAMAAGVESQDASVLVGVLRAMQDTPDVAASVRSHILEHKLAVARSILDRAAARGEIGGAADSAVVVELAAGLIFFRCIVLGQPLDDAFLEHVVDEVLLPLLTRR